MRGVWWWQLVTECPRRARLAGCGSADLLGRAQGAAFPQSWGDALYAHASFAWASRGPQTYPVPSNKGSGRPSRIARQDRAAMPPALASRGSLPAERRRRDREPVGHARLPDRECKYWGRRCEPATCSKKVVMLEHGGLKQGCTGWPGPCRGRRCFGPPSTEDDGPRSGLN